MPETPEMVEAVARSPRLQSGWLTEIMAEAQSDYAMSWPPDVDLARVRVASDIVPLSSDDARRLRTKMAARYHAWTGRSLSVDLASPEADGKDSLRTAPVASPEEGREP